MTKTESLCLPGCGFELSILNPFVVPAYDDFAPMIDGVLLEKINKHGVTATGEKTFTQLGVSQEEILENEQRTTAAEYELTNNIRDEKSELEILNCITPKHCDNSLLERSHSIQELFTELKGTDSYVDLLKGTTDNLTAATYDKHKADRVSNIQKNTSMATEIAILSKDLMLTSELVGNEIYAPCFRPITPVLRKNKKDNNKPKTAEKAAEKGKKRGKKCQKQLSYKTGKEIKKKTSEKHLVEENEENSTENGQETKEEKQEEREEEREDVDRITTCKSEEVLNYEAYEAYDGDGVKTTRSTISLPEIQNPVFREPPPAKETQQLDELVVEDVDQLLNMIDPRTDILSHTYLSTPARNQNTEITAQDEEGDLNTGAFDTMEDLAHGCLPNAYDLWKDKYRSLVLEEYPDAGNREIGNRLKELWCKIPDEHRQRYYDKAEKLVRRYNSSASLGYMNRFKCASSKYSKRGRPVKDYTTPSVPSVITPVVVRAKKPDVDPQTSERDDTAEDEDVETGNEADNEGSPAPFDFTKAMKETTTFNSQSDKDLRKKLETSQNVGGDDVELDFTDENAIATGVLVDIMMGEQQNEAGMMGENHEELTNMWGDHIDAGTDFMKTAGSLDISGLDEYLSGKGDNSFILEEAKQKKKRAKARSRKKKKNDKTDTKKEEMKKN